MRTVESKTLFSSLSGHHSINVKCMVFMRMQSVEKPTSLPPQIFWETKPFEVERRLAAGRETKEGQIKWVLVRKSPYYNMYLQSWSRPTCSPDLGINLMHHTHTAMSSCSLTNLPPNAKPADYRSNLLSLKQSKQNASLSSQILLQVPCVQTLIIKSSWPASLRSHHMERVGVRNAEHPNEFISALLILLFTVAQSVDFPIFALF